MNEQAKKWAGPAVPPGSTELADRFAVGQLAKIYALGMDVRDFDLARSAFAVDATADGKQGTESIDQHLKYTYGVASSFHATQHIISNQYVELKGDEAVLWSYGVAHHKVAPDEQRDEIIAGVIYCDVCKRIGSGWQITHRKVVPKWLDMGPQKKRS